VPLYRPNGHFHWVGAWVEPRVCREHARRKETRLRAITVAKVQAWIAKRLNEVSSNTVHQHLRGLRMVFRRSGLASPVGDHRLQVPDMVKTLPKAATWRSIVAKLAEVKKAEAWTDWMLLSIVACGVTRRELARCRWSDVDWEADEETLTVREPKVARLPRVLPIVEPVFDAVAVGQHPGDWLVPEEDRDEDEEQDDDPVKAEDRRTQYLRRMAERWKVGLHSWRHGFETRAVQVGVDQRLLDRLMGHSGGMGARYYHPTPQDLRAAMLKVWAKK